MRREPETHREGAPEYTRVYAITEAQKSCYVHASAPQRMPNSYMYTKRFSICFFGETPPPGDPCAPMSRGADKAPTP